MNFTKDLARWSTGADVYHLQNFLEKLGEGDFVPTGFYGDKTVLAVKRFQRRHGIMQTGNFYPITRAKMNAIINSPRDLFYWVAVGFLGVDASPQDDAPDELGCAETMNNIHLTAFEFPIGGDMSTKQMYKALAMTTYFVNVTTPERGDVVISPTGYGNGKLPNGHVGMVGENGVIMSNDSATGKFLTNYTLATWKKRYVDTGGFPMTFFRRV